MAATVSPPGQGQLFPLEAIRVETVLSRNPIHNLSRRTGVDIAIENVDHSGKAVFEWKVSYNSRYGQPGPLAYKLDTLVVNKRLEEAGQPAPKILRLGSLREICLELGVSEGQSKEHVKKALRQNAFAAITARLRYTGRDGVEHDFEFNDTRYGLILTGQRFPDGRRANGVYLVLHDLYRALLDRAPIRPLDYEYLKELTPGAQRFYELVSYQIFAAIRNGRSQARYRYSEYCTFAPQVRYTDWEHARKQMYKLHVPHVQSGYLAQIEAEPLVGEDGQADWCFCYTPGPKAFDEFNAFTMRRQPRLRRRDEESAPPLPVPSAAAPLASVSAEASSHTETVSEVDAAVAALAAALIEKGLSQNVARQLAQEKPEECRRQLEYLPFISEFKSSAGAYLRAAIERGFGPPKGYDAHARKEQARQARESAEAQVEARREARTDHERRYRAEYLRWFAAQEAALTASEPEALAAFEDGESKSQAAYRRTLPPGSPLLDAMAKDWEQPQFRAERLREFLRRRYPALQLPDFWAWDAKHNPHPFRPTAP